METGNKEGTKSRTKENPDSKTIPFYYYHHHYHQQNTPPTLTPYYYHHHYTTIITNTNTNSTTATIFTAIIFGFYAILSQCSCFGSICQLFNAILGYTLCSAAPDRIKLPTFVIKIQTLRLFSSRREPP